MRTDSLKLEYDRMKNLTIENYPLKHERHRIFPEIFGNRNHKKIIDISAGIGIVANEILKKYNCELSCNEVDENCIKELKKLNVTISSFDLDSGGPLPISDGSYDAIICLATIEHLINIDFFIKELHRILDNDGRLYLSVPNYASLYWLIPILKGKTFHDPFGERSRYEFYAHVRYLTYHSLVDFMEHFRFVVDTVYLPLPKCSSKFIKIRERSKLLSALLQNFFKFLYMISPRWHQEPVVCFKKSDKKGKVRKVIL